MRAGIRTLTVVGAVGALVAAMSGPTVAAPNTASATSPRHHIRCSQGRFPCTEVQDSEQAFGEGHYVGHDEPSVLYYSNRAGSGNRMRYELQLPKDPPAQPKPGRSYNFQLQIAYWFGMAMCDTQSYPELLKTCTPDSDRNIVDPTVSPRHPGAAYMEMQFYPPGWVPFEYATSCAATQWCAALTIDSYSYNPVTGTSNNNACLNTVGIEPVNFAFITKNGRPQAPPNPVNATLATYTPDPSRDLFMRSGDRIQIGMHDTSHGLRVDLRDLATGKTGYMVASASNGFGQVKFAPNAKTCTNVPYDFHPMYSTSSERTRVTWAAHSYNIAFDDEIGHFDYCTAVYTTAGTCQGLEGLPYDREKSDGDDVGCFTGALSFLVKVNGCIGTNTGFDGVSYQPLWPDGNYSMHPTPAYFSSPLTGARYNVNYQRVAFEGDQPRIEASDFGGSCNRDTGSGCFKVPITDDGVHATFYPFYTTGSTSRGCRWTIGTEVPHFSTRDYGAINQYGSLLKLSYTTVGGGYITRYNDFRRVLSNNPCRSGY